MKSSVFTILLWLSVIQAFAQLCYREGQFMDGPDYPVKGKATIERQQDGSLLLKFDAQFSTSPGPDLDVYLSNTATPSSSSVNIAALKSTAGAQTYTLPNHVAFSGYEYVIIHCTQFNHFWGNAKLGSQMGNCTGTYINENAQVDIRVFAGGRKIHISTSGNENKAYQAGIYDLLGNQVLFSEGVFHTKTEIMVNDLSSGIYFIRLKIAGTEVTRKIYLN